MRHLERTFVENPFDGLKIVVPTLVGIFIVAAVIVMASGVPPSRKGMQLSTGGFLLMIFFCNAFLLAIILGVMSCFKKRTIVCDADGCSISAIDYWGAMAPDENFKWRDVTDTNLISTHAGKGGYQLSVEVSIHETRIRLLTRNWFSSLHFDELLEVVNAAASHLEHELVMAPPGPDAYVLEEVHGYCKVKRRTV